MTDIHFDIDDIDQTTQNHHTQQSADVPRFVVWASRGRIRSRKDAAPLLVIVFIIIVVLGLTMFVMRPNDLKPFNSPHFPDSQNR